MKEGKTHNRWQKLKHIFSEALELEKTEREAYIEKACGEDRELKEEVLSLLAAHEISGAIDRSPEQLVKASFSIHEPGEKKGEQVGPYQIIETLGHGGMGSVYLAERTDGQFEQQVALKLLQTGFTSENQNRRFMSERQILATLNHENIGRLLDGGITAEGQPWFAMEYVKGGRPIDEHCDANQLTINQRLNLFLKVCEAVQFAQRQLIIHRDIKPSNILVTQTGTVKLLDFGIAKVLNQDERSAGAYTMTRTGLLPLTPAYASPEQVRRAPVTTATDIYQLGVVLYELLIGCRPYDVSGKTPGEIEQIICEKQPTRPSTVITRLLPEQNDREHAVRKITGARQTKADKLRKHLQGDLDKIVLKTLRKEPERRYDSVEQLTADIRNYLSGRPVMAHPDSIGYRARKFMSRHSTGVVATAVIVLLLIGYAVTITWQSQRTREALERARQETAKSEQITGFLMDMFKASDPKKSLGDNIPARVLLQRGIEQAERLDNQPEIQAQMLDVTGRVYMNLGKYTKAESLLDKALDIRRRHLESAHPDISESLHNLGFLFWKNGKYKKAEGYLREALSMEQKIYDGANESLAKTKLTLAVVLKQLRKFEEAEPLYRDALEMNREIHGDRHESVAYNLNNLANFMESQGDYKKAEELYLESLKIYRDLYGNNHPDVAGRLTNLGRVKEWLGDLEESVLFHEKALKIRRSVFDEQHPDIAESLYYLGRARTELEQYDKAETFLKQALNIQRAVLDSLHPNISQTLNNLGIIMGRKEDYEAAERYYLKTLDLQKKRLGNAHSEVGITLNNIGLALIKQGRYDEALRYLEESRDVLFQNYEEDHPMLTYPLLGIAHIHLDKNRPEEAEPLLRKSLEIQLSAVGEDHWLVGVIKSRLGKCLAAMEAFEEAEDLMIDGFETLDAELGTSHERTQRSIKNLINLYEAWSKQDSIRKYRDLYAGSDM